MYADDVIYCAFIALAGGIFFGMGFLIYVEMKDDQAARLSCINAGKSWIESSCVKVSP